MTIEPFSSRIGTLKRKYMTFDLWPRALDNEEDSQIPVGGGEIKAISCLLPRKKKKGKLYPGSFWFFLLRFTLSLIILVVAPKPIARHLGPCGATRETYTLNKELVWKLQKSPTAVLSKGTS